MRQACRHLAEKMTPRGPDNFFFEAESRRNRTDVCPRSTGKYQGGARHASVPDTCHPCAPAVRDRDNRAPNSTRIAETGAYLLGNAHRCGVRDERVVRAGGVIRELIIAASGDPKEQMAAQSRFAKIFRAAALPESDGHAAIPPCKTVLTQFDRLEQFRDPATSK